MSSTVKGILLRTPPEVAYIHRMFKDRSLNGGVNGCSGRAGQTRYQPQAATITNGITNPSPKKNELQISPGQIGAQAITSPVLDPSTPTTHKVTLILESKVAPLWAIDFGLDVLTLFL